MIHCKSAIMSHLQLLLETEWLVQTKLSNILFENFLFLFKKDVQILWNGFILLPIALANYWKH